MLRTRSVSEKKNRWMLRALVALLAFTAAAVLLAVPANAQPNARVVQRNLAEMVGDSHTILLGRVLSVQSERHPQYQGLKTMVVTLDVIEMIKGQSGAPFTFRQYITDESEAQGKLGYKNGQEVLLLLLRPHPKTNLSSPAGLDQGRFRIVRDAQGNRVVANGVNNGGLFRGIDTAKYPRLQALNVQTRTMLTEHRGGPITYDQLKAVIQALGTN